MTNHKDSFTKYQKQSAASHLKVLALPICLSVSAIFFSSKSSIDSITPPTECFSISAESKRELSIKGDESVVIIRPHGCLSCGYGDANIKSKISASKLTFICLLDSDATASDINSWQISQRVKIIRRDQVSISLRKLTTGLYFLGTESSEVCKLEANQI